MAPEADSDLLTPVFKAKTLEDTRQRAGQARALKSLFEPGAIAVIGASRREGSVGHAVFRNLLMNGYTGTLYPVNPKHPSIMGVKCHQSVLEIPEPVDLAVVAIPAAGVVTSRGDVHYVVTEYGAVDLHGKSIRDRALALIHIAHPDFREELMRVARERHFVYADQVVVPDAGLPELEELESDFLSHGGVGVHFRPIEPTDEPLLQELFYRSSEKTIYLRFFSHLKALPHRRAQQFVAVDYQHHLALVGTVMEGERQVIIAVGRYHLDPATNRADCAFMVRDDWQDKGVGRYLVGRLIAIARNRGIEGMTADVLVENTRMMHVFHLCAPGPIQSRFEEGAYHISFALAR